MEANLYVILPAKFIPIAFNGKNVLTKIFCHHFIVKHKQLGSKSWS